MRTTFVLIAFFVLQSAAHVNGNTPPSFGSIQFTIEPEPAREASVLTALPVGWEDADGDTEQYLYDWYNQDGPLRGTVDFSDEIEAQYKGMTSVEFPSPLPLPSGLELRLSVAGVQKGTVKFTGPSGAETVYEVDEEEGSNINGSFAVNLAEVGEYTVTETIQAIIRSKTPLIPPFESQAGEEEFNWTYVNPAPGERLYRHRTRVHQITFTATGDLAADLDVTNPGAEVGLTLVTQRRILPGSTVKTDIDYELAFSKYSSLSLVDSSVTERSLTGANFDAGDEVYVVITPYDGTDFGEPLESERVLILSETKSTDINGDGVVNILDLVIVANKLGEQVEEGTEASADVNKDGVVNILDLVAVASDI